MPSATKPFAAEILLGQCIEQARLKCGLTRRELARAINEKEQQVVKYESGGFVPLPQIEAITEALGDPVQKKYIRRISFLRKLEKETGTEQVELFDLYREVFADIGGD